MAMSGNAMGTEIADALLAAGEITAAQHAATEARWQTVCGALVAHVAANAAYTVPATPAGDGLQVSTAVGAPTAGPAAPVTISGQIS